MPTLSSTPTSAPTDIPAAGCGPDPPVAGAPAITGPVPAAAWPPDPAAIRASAPTTSTAIPIPSHRPDNRPIPCSFRLGEPVRSPKLVCGVPLPFGRTPRMAPPDGDKPPGPPAWLGNPLRPAALAKGAGRSCSSVAQSLRHSNRGGPESWGYLSPSPSSFRREELVLHPRRGERVGGEVAYTAAAGR